MLFALGVAGFLFRRNIITVFMSIELMLNAVNLSFITFSYKLKQVDGHIFSFFVMVVAAAEAAVGLAIILTVFKNRQTLEIDEVSSLKNLSNMQLWLIPTSAARRLPAQRPVRPAAFQGRHQRDRRAGSVLLSFLWVLKTLSALGVFSGGNRAANGLRRALLHLDSVRVAEHRRRFRDRPADRGDADDRHRRRVC